MYCRLWSPRHYFLLCQWDCVKEGVHRGFAKASAALMRPAIVVLNQPGIEIGLQLVERVIDLLAERDPLKLVQDSAMEALADSIIRHDDFRRPVFALSLGKGLW
jgi:hypothetical protein